MKKVLAMVLAMVMVLAVGCQKTATEDKQTATDTPVNENGPVVTMTIKGYGDIVLQLDPVAAPNTVKNFLSLADSGFYNGLSFHRVISGFMIQGGDPNGDGTGDPGYSIKGEFNNNGFENPILHTKGVISMARSSDPNSGGSQFFIMHADAPHLDGDYAAFGKVISGIELVDKIAEVAVDGNDKPEEAVIIEKMSVDAKGFDFSTFEKTEN